MRLLRRAYGPAVLFLLAACVGAPQRIDSVTQPIELSSVPFFAQTEHHCGPAALATVLAAHRPQITPDQLTPLIYLPGREGSLQAEMIAATRRYDRLPLKVESTPEALHAALQAGDPVLLLQNLGFRRWPAWHYAVLVGFDPAGQDYVLRSGTEQRLVTGSRRFFQTWDRSERWGFTAVSPDRVPAYATAANWLAAAAPFESLGRLGIAEQAYRAALQRWPESSLAWQGLANTRYAANDKPAAEVALRKAVELDPGSVPARNNLANVLLERGCAGAAAAQLAGIDEVTSPFAMELRQTRAAIEAAGGTDAVGCGG